MTTLSREKVLSLAVMSLVLAVSMVFAWLCLLAIVRTEMPITSPVPTSAGSDFVAFYAGAKLAAAGHPELAYDPKTVHPLEKRITHNDGFRVLPIVYPPSYLLALTPLASFDYVTAYRVWVILTLTLLAAVAWRLSPHWHTLLLLPIFPAVAFCAAAGQNGNLSAAILGAGLLLLPRRPVAAGIVFGLMAYKPQLALVLPFCLVAGRHYRALIATAMSAIGTTGVGLLAFGPATMAAFLPSLAAQSQQFFAVQQHRVWPRMPTVMVAMLQMTDDRAVAWVVQLLVAGAAGAAVVWIWRRSTDLGWRSLAMVTAIPLMTPYFIDYDLALLVIPALLLANELRTKGWHWNTASLLGAVWLAYPLVFLFRLAPAMSGGVQPGALVWVLLLGYAAWQILRRKVAETQPAGMSEPGPIDRRTAGA